ncbi:MAG: hypothetical protein KGL39_48460 [Patescibacteria group bacterium]|nr:hypothetical protein [Patescibacteria group bacterium]
MDTPTKLHSASWIGKSHHREPLREQFNPQDLDPTFQGNPDFDWKTVLAHLDGESEDSEEIKKETMELSAIIAKKMIDWLINIDFRDPRVLKIIGAKAIAMAWVLDLERFDGQSLTTIGKSLGYTSGVLLGRHASEFSKTFGVTNKYQQHDWRKEKAK